MNYIYTDQPVAAAADHIATSIATHLRPYELRNDSLVQMAPERDFETDYLIKRSAIG